MNVQKNHVSILQEMMVKKGMAPNYELIEGGTGHVVTFTYKVTCDGLTATGTGRCKKDAKHEAATAMLAKIAQQNALPQLPASPSESPVRTPLPMTLPVCPKSPANVPFCNAIGKLQELCITNNLNDPEYKETGDVGPPHARVFTIQCRVSTFVEEGTATTKKQAKHEAARKMVERISGVVSDDPTLAKINDENKKREQISSNLAIARYPLLNVANETVKSKVNWGLLVKNFYKRLKSRYEEDVRNDLIEKLDDLLNLIIKYEKTINEENLAQIKEDFEKILNTMDIQYQRNSFNVDDENIKSAMNEVNFIVGIQLNTIPDIHEVSMAKTEVKAEFLALKRVVSSVKFFLQ